MEALALLCTLHADGPTSLRRLRRAGCDSLESLERMAPDELAGVLEVPPAVARRLGREARGLSSRIGPELDDREEAPEFGKATAELPRAEGPAGLGRRERAIVDRVVGRWGESEGREVPPLVVEPPVEEEPVAEQPAPVPEVIPEPAPEPEPMAEVAREPVLSEPVPNPEPEPVPEPIPVARREKPLADPILATTVEERPEPEPELETIPAGMVTGLDESLSMVLAEAGVRDLNALVAADALSLSQRIGKPFAVLRRLQFLAAKIAPLVQAVEEETPAPESIAFPKPTPPAEPETEPRQPEPPAAVRPIAAVVEPVVEPVVELPVAEAPVVETPVVEAPIAAAPAAVELAVPEPEPTAPIERASSGLVPANELELPMPDSFEDTRAATESLELPRVETPLTEAGPLESLATPEAQPHPEATPAPGATSGAESESRRKFWEPLPRWADKLNVQEMEQPTPLPPEDPTPPARSRKRRPRRAGRTLNWSFEPPADGPVRVADATLELGERKLERFSPAESPSAAPAPLDPPGRDEPEEGAAGPFA